MGTFMNIIFAGFSWRQHEQVPFPFYCLPINWKDNLSLVHNGNVSPNFFFNLWLYYYILSVSIGFSLVLSLGLRLFWCWVKPEAVSFIRCACESLMLSWIFWSPLRFGCWCVDYSFFHWSSVSSSGMICENSLLIIFSIYNYHAGTH